MGGYTFYNLGTASVKLERENYADDVLKVYDNVVTDLTSVSPSGRLSIFDGPPGTGKTFLIRGILEVVEDAMFVLVPPEMMNMLASPELIPLLIRKKASSDVDGPVVFILEDGDNVLVPRKKENLSLISSLLNFSSGILGSMLDIRVITTTNSPKVDIDPALMRAGRLSDHITVGHLDDKQADEILSRLLGKKSKMPHKSEGQNVLADVYKEARKHGWRPKAVSKSNGMERAVPFHESRQVRVVDSKELGEGLVIYPKTRGWDARV
jgi:SpoVK/Ycf46/Vps4 family AAA+-type ATPase